MTGRDVFKPYSSTLSDKEDMSYFKEESERQKRMASNLTKEWKEIYQKENNMADREKLPKAEPHRDSAADRVLRYAAGVKDRASAVNDQIYCKLARIMTQVELPREVAGNTVDSMPSYFEDLRDLLRGIECYLDSIEVAISNVEV